MYLGPKVGMIYILGALGYGMALGTYFHNGTLSGPSGFCPGSGGRMPGIVATFSKPAALEPHLETPI